VDAEQVVVLALLLGERRRLAGLPDCLERDEVREVVLAAATHRRDEAQAGLHDLHEAESDAVLGGVMRNDVLVYGRRSETGLLDFLVRVCEEAVSDRVRPRRTRPSEPERAGRRQP
jgi:hypothetical protein